MSRHAHESLAYVLHRHHYGETSRLLRCFTKEYGKIDLLAKGQQMMGKSIQLSEPFRLYHLIWSGRSQLKTLHQADEHEVYLLNNQAKRLYCGFYLNELVDTVIRPNESEPLLFALYRETLQQLSECAIQQIPLALRRFELQLMPLAGYGIDFQVERDGKTPIVADQRYHFELGKGFYRTSSAQRALCHGDTIQAIACDQWLEQRQLDETKRLTRFLIEHYLTDGTIQSRQFFA